MNIKITIARHELPAFERAWLKTDYFNFSDYRKTATAHGYEIWIEQKGAGPDDLVNLGRELQKQIQAEDPGKGVTHDLV